VPEFTINTARFSPYPTFRFLVYFSGIATPVAAVNKVGAIKMASAVIEYKAGGDPITRKSVGRTTYDPIMLERGVTFATEFEDWAAASQVLTNGDASTSLANLRKEVTIVLLNEEAQQVRSYLVHRAWVSEYQALPELDAGANALAIEHVKLENEGWERVPLAEQKET
jgi:phage tail-like protein